MKGTEGIDYVVTECGHCKGEGKCNCFDCLYTAATDAAPTDDHGDYRISERDRKIEYLQEKKFSAKCTVCRGVGKVVFWREKSDSK